MRQNNAKDNAFLHASSRKIKGMSYVKMQLKFVYFSRKSPNERPQTVPNK